MAELQARVRERLRTQVRQSGGSSTADDPELFAEADALLRSAAQVSDTAPLLLPELLGEPDRWRLSMAVRYTSHRGGRTAALLTFLKRRVLMPPLRWLYEYSRDNFERQRRTNHVLFACVQELALETARLRREVERLSSAPRGSDPIEPT